MTNIKLSLRSVSLSVALVFSLNAFANKDKNTNELNESLTIGIEKSLPLTQGVDGLYRNDGVAAVISEPNFIISNKINGKTENNKNDFILIAKEYLRSNAAKFGLNQNAIENLALQFVRTDKEFSVVRFIQQVHNIPVYGSSIAVTVNNKGRVTFVASNTVTGNLEEHKVLLDSLTSFSQEQALKIALNYLRIEATKFTKANYVIFKDTQNNVHEAWHFKVIPAKGNGDWDILIDSAQGNILRAENKIRNYSATAKVYKTDPLSTVKLKYGDAGFADNIDNPKSSNSSQQPKDTPELSKARTLVTLPDVTFINNNYSLTSKYAVCDDFESPNDNACPVQTANLFDFDRTNKYFDAVNVFYHIDNYLRYVNETLNVSVMPYQYKGGVHYDPHGLGGDDNSHYSESSGKLAFGQGGVDDAEDLMVVIHELGHGIHDWLTHGNSENDAENGLGEGTGDYLAAGYVRDIPENLWKPTDPKYNWVMRWDGHNPFWPGRVSNWHIGRKYPQDVIHTGDNHASGQYWSSCNLVARDKIGGQAMDKVFLSGLSKTVESTNQVGAAQAIINAAKDLKYSNDQIKGIAYAYNTVCSYNVKIPITDPEE
ncbi:hypothetical protein QEJ31_10730 [Pigmentibacter sp. JX0631]|uniref:hypothetical protein n=1 Tax=Pigmentibacter sp. JX0631 TaxID=2976982 RepID=UPI0024691C13|nr:hypothetical protein [Pigmentibacter sp. JX0631]WGL58994.1 hypothetical protein QEJ31_10730 [Pigmentibacter sp. JX0631]